MGSDTASTPAAVVSVASALEIFHAAALIHDDIMDNSDTRRGSPSAHRHFEHMHTGNRWTGDAAQFGHSSALLLGDLLLGWSDELLDEGLMELGNADAARMARALFNRMRTEVTAGQYLDIREEQAWSVQPEQEQLTSALRIITYKSAKYSIQAPLVIGAALGAGGKEQIESLSLFGLPLGVAFQLRDDLLGVFGDPAVTGKPAGDDLREGKRTVLIALARQRMVERDHRRLDAMLGSPDLSTGDVRMLQDSIRQSGAVDEVEALISEKRQEAEIALDGAPLEPVALERLRELTRTATRRTA